MNDTLDFDVRYSVDDYARALHFIKSRSFPLKYAVIVAVVCLIFIVGILLFISFGLANSSPEKRDIVGITIIPFLVTGIIFLMMKNLFEPIQKWHISRQFRSSPILNEVQHISINASGIKGQTNLGHGETRWEAFIEATESKSDFFFFTTKNFALFIPKYAVSGDESQQILREFALRKLGNRASFLQ